MNAPSHAPITIATAGEALMDMIVEADGRLRPCEGGAVYNLTRATALQGVGTLYLNPISRDRFGNLLSRRIHEAGVVLAHPEPVPEPTSLAVVGLDADGKASYSFYREGVADRQIDARSLTAACNAQPALRIVVTGCLALLPEDASHYQPWLATQRATGHWVVVDANLRPAVVPDMGRYRASVMAALEHAHLIKVSDDDLLTLGFEDADPRAAARRLLAQSRADALALTLGPDGALLMARDGRAWHAVEEAPVPVTDTVGAGDCFLAGLLAAWCEQPSLLAAHTGGLAALDSVSARHLLQRAVASASLCVQQTGCVPPTRAQVLARTVTMPARVCAT